MSIHPKQQHALIGHTAAEQQIVQAIAGGRMPHAWLITGEEGVGKATLAYRFARFMLSNKKVADALAVEAENSASKLISAGSHPDLLVLERPFDEKKGRYLQNIPVEDVRKISPFLRLTASQGKWRIVIVDGAGSLNRNGQNAILKILEEPPENALIILTAESAASLLPTIRSRARVLKLNRLNDEELHHLAEQNEITADIDFMVNLAEGSAARLMRYSACEANILYQNWCDFLREPYNLLIRTRLAESWSGRNNDDVYYTAQDMMFLWLHRIIKAKARGDKLAALLPLEKPLLGELYPRLNIQKLMDLRETLLQQAQEAEHSNLDHKIVVMAMLDKAAYAIAA